MNVKIIFSKIILLSAAALFVLTAAGIVNFPLRRDAAIPIYEGAAAKPAGWPAGRLKTPEAQDVDANAEIVALEEEHEEEPQKEEKPAEKKNFIKWVDLNTDGEILKSVLKLCKDCRKRAVRPANNIEPDFCEVLAYLATKNGNNFQKSTDEAALKKLRKHLDEGKAVSDIYGDNKYYKYNLESYHAVFDGIIGEFKRGESGETEYGIKSYFPIANGFWYNHYDDFGSKRVYGYKRRHLGHDIMGSVGTPIVSLEAGTVTELGWNQYGGWRVGIRSYDGKRYYYYAHLRKDKPYPANLKHLDNVEAGQVIGFLGHTGYSRKENVNLKSGNPHLHIGLQIIFDESQLKGPTEIWVDMYGICNLLQSERVKVIRDENTKEWISQSYKFSE